MINKKRISVILSMFLSIFLVAAINNVAAQDSNVVEVINNSENHTIFADLLNETGFSDVVAKAGPYTIVAPTNRAFEEMDTNLDELRASPDNLESLVISHLFQGEVPAQKAEASLGIEITDGDLPASNGLVHISNEVIEN